MNGWNYISDLRPGISHVKTGRACQDCVLITDGDCCLTAALADGIGSGQHSEIAAKAAVTGLCNLFAEYHQEQLDTMRDASDNVKKRILTSLRESVSESAERQGFSVSSMDCTLVFVCVAKKMRRAFIGRIGDSTVCVIRKEGQSEAFSSHSLSANRTHTLLEPNAENYFELHALDLSDEDIVAFILTSDGLNNELYMKGSHWVCHNAGEYVNALRGGTSDSAKEVIAQRLTALTDNYGDIFRDDISYAVLSRAKELISLPDDPTWLCSCGTRNHLWETYCRRCHMDFVKLYRNVNFAGETKAEFFSRLNADEARERRTIGLRPAKGKISPPLFIAFGLSLLALLLLCLRMEYSIMRDIRLLKERTDVIQSEIVRLRESAATAETGDSQDGELSLAKEMAAVNEKLERLLNQSGRPVPETAVENGETPEAMETFAEEPEINRLE